MLHVGCSKHYTYKAQYVMGLARLLAARLREAAQD